MKRVPMVLLGLFAMTPVIAWHAQSSVPQAPVASPAPLVQNGRVVVGTGTNIDREIASVSGAGNADPEWVAWRAPMISGDRDLCSWYSDRLGTVRGIYVDDALVMSGAAAGEPAPRPAIVPPTGPIPLEAGTNIVVLARIVGGRVERLRTVGDDCPMDAGGRTVHWLEQVTAAESLRYLEGLATAALSNAGVSDAERRVAETAVRAIGYHRDAAADTALTRIASDVGSSVGRQAANTLASMRGASGAAAISQLLGTPMAVDRRVSLVTALGQSRDASAVTTFRTLVRDAEPRVRAEASYWFVQRGGVAVVPDALKIVASDQDATVRKRIVSAIGRLPDDAGVPLLIQLARSTSDATVRKDAVTVLSQSKDARAVAFMEEILKR